MVSLALFVAFSVAELIFILKSIFACDLKCEELQMIEINHFEEVTQIKLSQEMNGKPLYWAAVYLVDGLQIDTGPEHTAEELVNFLKGQNVKFAVNTHHHEDYIGANHLLQQRLGIQIYAHPKAVPLINQVPKLLQYQEMVWGYPEPTKVLPSPDKIDTEHFHFNIVETPGHSAGHIAVVEQEKGCAKGWPRTSSRERRLAIMRGSPSRPPLNRASEPSPWRKKRSIGAILSCALRSACGVSRLIALSASSTIVRQR